MAEQDYDDLAPGAFDEAPDSGDTRPSFLLTEGLLAATRPRSIQAESFRALRSNLLAQHVHRGRRALAICSPAPAAGCSFLAANLAYVMAQAGVNTLLIDGNLREPGVQQYITGDLSGPGLAECLADDTLPLGNAIHRVQPALSVLYAGQAGEGAGVRASAIRTNPEVPVFAEVSDFLRALAGGLGQAGRQVLLARS